MYFFLELAGKLTQKTSSNFFSRQQLRKKTCCEGRKDQEFASRTDKTTGLSAGPHAGTELTPGIFSLLLPVPAPCWGSTGYTSTNQPATPNPLRAWTRAKLCWHLEDGGSVMQQQEEKGTKSNLCSWGYHPLQRSSTIQTERVHDIFMMVRSTRVPPLQELGHRRSVCERRMCLTYAQAGRKVPA